jgi:hypothetical protein
MTAHVHSPVAQEIAAGNGLSMGKIAKRFGVSPATASRWVSKGLPDGNGGRRKLESIRRGRAYFTSEAALARFFGGLPQINMREPPAVPASLTVEAIHPPQQKRDAGQATQILKTKFNY